MISLGMTEGIYLEEEDSVENVFESVWDSVSNAVFGFSQKSRFYGFFSPKPTRLALKPTFLKPTFLAVENRI